MDIIIRDATPKYSKPTREQAQNRDHYILGVVSYFAKSHPDRRLEFHLNAGEISVSRYVDKVLKIIMENENYRLYFSANAIVYSESIAKFLESGRARIIISPDSGTRETMAKVRGYDCYDKTWSAIEKYSKRIQNRDDIFLKYIILEGINDNDYDIT
jgi:molybdenum cofactor biosynthesis enzyme MoaA